MLFGALDGAGQELVTGKVAKIVKKVLLVMMVIAAALGTAAYWVKTSYHSGSENGYTFEPVQFGSLTEVVSATGLLQPQDVAAVVSDIPGRVVEVKADFNDFVTVGQPLLKLDDALANLKVQEADDAVQQAQAALQAVQAQNKGAESALKFQKKIEAAGFNKDLIKAEADVLASSAAVEVAKSKISQAKTAQQQARLALDRTIVKAPITGTIIDKQVFLGQPVGPIMPSSIGQGKEIASALGSSGGPLFIIAKDLKKMQVHAQIGEVDISKLRVGLPASFTVYAYSDGDIHFDGKVEQIRLKPIMIQGSAVFFTTIIDVENKRDADSKNAQQWMLRPGMTANVEIIRRNHDKVWKAPVSALNFPLDEHYQTEAAKTKIAEWDKKKNREDWKLVWVMDAHKKPWPIFVRIGGVSANGETGIKDGQYNEVLEWDPSFEPKPDAAAPQTYPQLIITAPPATKPGFFDRPTGLKLS